MPVAKYGPLDHTGPMIDKSRGPRILVMRAGQLGDTVFATSLIEPLRCHFGSNTSIDLVVKRGVGSLFAQDARIGRVFELAHRNLPIPLNLDKNRVALHSRRHSYDLLVNLEMGAILDDLVRLVRARRKVGSPYRTVADDRDGEHAVEHLRRCYRSFLPAECVESITPDLQGAPAELVKARFALPEAYLVLNPTNSTFAKHNYRSYRAWPLEHWRQLIQALDRDHSLPVVLVGGKGEREYFRHLDPLPASVRSLAGETRLDELVTILAGARALITTDTGPSHLAAAVGTPVLAVLGPTDHRKTGPYRTANNIVRTLSAGLECSPCFLTPRIRECSLNRCMHLVTPAMVLEALATLPTPASR